MKFTKKGHKYVHEGNEYISVTQLLSPLFPFDEKAVAKKLSKIPKFKAEKKGVRYWLKEWKKNREYGTRVHKEIDILLKNCHQDVTPEAARAFDWTWEYPRKLGEPHFATEVLIKNDKHKIAGTIDLMIEHNGEGTNRVITLIDWKVTKEITKVNKYERMFNCLGFPNANFWKYSLQLNFYAWMLKEEGYMIDKMIIVHLKGNELTEYEVPVMFDKVGEILREKNEQERNN